MSCTGKGNSDADKKSVIFYIILISVIGYFTYFHNYYKPSSLFWDENYHVVNSQKYLDNVMYMHGHPPLGKLLIALGEYITGANDDIDKSFLSKKATKTKSVPKGYSFIGVRLFPSLLAFFSGIIFFLIMYRIYPDEYLSFLFTFFYLFQNAFIVHFRGAMLDGIEIFFLLCAVLYFLTIYNNNTKYKVSHYFILGLLSGLSIAVKVNAAVLCFLFVFLFFFEYGDDIFTLKIDFNILKNLVIKSAASLAGIIIIISLTYYIHFALGKKIINNNYYSASTEYVQIIENRETANPLHFSVMMRDSFSWFGLKNSLRSYNPNRYESAASLPITWPLGIKSISYRWLKKSGKVQYLYLQINPLIWYTALLGLILSVALILNRLVRKTKIADERLFKLLCAFTGCYIFYMISVIQVRRVLYLYHYFIPLLFCLFLCYILFIYKLEKFYIRGDKKFNILILSYFISVIIIFIYFSPLTYYKPLTEKEFSNRSWLKIWDLKHK